MRAVPFTSSIVTDRRKMNLFFMFVLIVVLIGVVESGPKKCYRTLSGDETKKKEILCSMNHNSCMYLKYTDKIEFSGCSIVDVV